MKKLALAYVQWAVENYDDVALWVHEWVYQRAKAKAKAEGRTMDIEDFKWRR